jgi:hypothetical protein
MQQFSWRKLMLRVHRDERGAVVAAIALPILIYLIKFGWPSIKKYFESGMQNLENEGNNVTTGGSGTGSN